MGFQGIEESHNPGWELFVELDDLVITRVVEFLQENGWDGSLKRIRRDADITEEVLGRLKQAKMMSYVQMKVKQAKMMSYAQMK